VTILSVMGLIVTLACSKIESSEFNYYEKSVNFALLFSYTVCFLNSGKTLKAYSEKLPSYKPKQGLKRL
jgi:hypothetical protein